MVKRVLMVAYHYPPVQVSSGLQRTLAFSTYLREHGWEPIVLSAHPRAYSKVSDDQLKDIPSGLIVERAFSIDASRHLSIGGRYLDISALPDRWSSWLLGGVWSGLRLVRKYKPRVIWSTYPIATAHLIGWTLHKLTGLPWVADFRDSMTEDSYPRDGLKRKVFLWIEKRTVSSCTKAVFTTPGAVSMYRNRYPEFDKDKWLLLPNGYNEEVFSEVEAELTQDNSGIKPIREKDIITLVHSGVIYPEERDPNHFFLAISRLVQKGIINHNRVKIILRATGHDQLFQPILQRLGIDDVVSLEPGVSYRQALKEMFMADGLIIFQAANCNHQVPAKVYEYFRARRPILALTDINGDTAKTLVEAGLLDIVPLDNAEAIQKKLLDFLTKIENESATVANDGAINKYSRQEAAGVLAKCLDEVCD